MSQGDTIHSQIAIILNDLDRSFHIRICALGVVVQTFEVFSRTSFFNTDTCTCGFSGTDTSSWITKH